MITVLGGSPCSDGTGAGPGEATRACTLAPGARSATAAVSKAEASPGVASEAEPATQSEPGGISAGSKGEEGDSWRQARSGGHNGAIQ